MHIDLHPWPNPEMFIVDSKESENKSCENIKSTPLVVLKINASAVVLSYIFIGQSEALKYRENIQFFIIVWYDEFFI